MTSGSAATTSSNGTSLVSPPESRVGVSAPISSSFSATQGSTPSSLPPYA